jgi:hypothetical protein
MKYAITIFIILVLVLVLVLWYFYTVNDVEQFDTNGIIESSIPKKIWTYWEGDLPVLVQKCID